MHNLREKPLGEGLNNSKTSVLVLILLFLFLGLLTFFWRESSTGEEAANLMTSNCWEKFKKENCNLSNPLGTLCRELYECYLREREQKSKDNNGENQDSWIEEVIFTVVATLAGGYYMGTERLRTFWRFLFDVIR